jgi:hypothetical protein
MFGDDGLIEDDRLVEDDGLIEDSSMPHALNGSYEAGKRLTSWNPHRFTIAFICGFWIIISLPICR